MGERGPQSLIHGMTEKKRNLSLICKGTNLGQKNRILLPE